MKPKVLVAIIILLLLLMIATVAVGTGTMSTRWFTGSIDLQNGEWTTSMRDGLTADLPAAAIVNMRPRTCRPSDTRVLLSPNATCQATITATDDSTRQLQMELLQGDAVTVILEQENALTVEVIIERSSPGEVPSASIDIYKDEELRDSTLRIMDCRLPAQEESAEDDATTEDNEEDNTVTNCVLALAT